MKNLSLDQSPLNWFDLLVVITILLGVRKGRKNGMSIEMMPMLQWICIVIAGAFLYRPFGDMMAQSTPMPRLFCYITVYVITAIVIKGLFTLLKKGAGGKLSGSDLFGRGEFYLGAAAGAVRFLCVLLAALALLNAPYYSQAEMANNKAYQLKEYGSDFFPGFSNVQVQVFRESFLGGMLKKQAEVLLIASTRSDPPKGGPKRKDDLPF